MAKRMRLGELLLKAGAITDGQLQAGLDEQRRTGTKLGEALLKNGWITERKLVDALSQQLNISVLSLLRYKPDPEVLRLVPENVAKRHEAVPLSKLDDSRILVAVADPLNVVGLDEIRMVSGMDVEVGVATISEVRRALKNFYSTQGQIQEMTEAMHIEIDPKKVKDVINLESMAESADAADIPVVKLTNQIIERAVEDKASDIHIEAQEKRVRVRYRIDGMLFDIMELPQALHAPLISRIKILGNMDIAEKRLPQDGRIAVSIQERKIDLRVSSLPTAFGEKIVIRLLDKNSSVVGMEKIGLDAQEKSVMEDILKSPYGIILVTGPTGSGKSTTLYSLLMSLNQPEVNILTVEDPIEYTLQGINQVQVNEKSGLTFTEALRSFLRQDPDKILVGEVRDRETAELAIRAALTGHLVLSSLHTNDAPSSIMRIVDMGIPPFLIASSLTAVIAQRLVRKLCPSCKQTHIPPDSAFESMGIPSGTTLYKATGCEACNNTGYKGRTAIFEIMVVSEEIRDLVLTGSSSSRIRQLAIAEGMRTLRSAGIRKAVEGITSIEEVFQVTL